MIMIDIPEPKRCEECPCSYFIRSGEYEGMMMCNAMEFKDTHLGFHEELSKYFIVEENHRPENCPITVLREG